MSYLGWSEKKFHSLYSEGAWQESATQPEIPVSAACVQYAQSVIEGMKAYRSEKGQVIIFRLEAHYQRLNFSLKRLNLPALELDFFSHALKSIVATPGQWESPLHSDTLYIRPIVYGLEGEIFPQPSKRCGFSIYTAPVGNFGKEYCKIQLYDGLTRSSTKGINSAKTALNYAPIIAKSTQNQGATHVWYDPLTGAIEEADTANVFFRIGEKEVVTPSLNNRILGGITRDSVIEIIHRETPYTVLEREITVQEVVELCRREKLLDCFMTSTGIGIQPVHEVGVGQESYLLNRSGGLAQTLKLKYLDTIFGQNANYKSWRYLV